MDIVFVSYELATAADETSQEVRDRVSASGVAAAIGLLNTAFGVKIDVSSIRRSASGRPLIQGADSKCDFNISHTAIKAGGEIAHYRIAVAASVGARVGIDVEGERSVFTHPGLWSKYLSDNERELILADFSGSDTAGDSLRGNKSTALLVRKLWVAKEAIAKASGKGLQMGFRSIDLSDQIDKIREGVDFGYRDGGLHFFEDPTTAGAVYGTGSDLRFVRISS